MILNNNTTSMGLRPAWDLHIFVRSASSKGVRNISKSTNNDNCSNGLPILERASIENSSSNRLSPLGMRYVVYFACIFVVITPF